MQVFWLNRICVCLDDFFDEKKFDVDGSDSQNFYWRDFQKEKGNFDSYYPKLPFQRRFRRISFVYEQNNAVIHTSPSTKQ